MEMLDKYKLNASSTSTSSGTSQPTTQSSSTSASDYYSLAKQQEYSKLLDSEVQLENAKQNAMKYTQNQINAQGLGGSGVGSSMQSGMYNKYLNSLGSARQDYNTNIQTLDYQQAQEQQANADDRFQSITTMIGTADDLDSLNSMLSDYGVGSYDSSGNFTLSKTKPEGMSDDDWYQMKYYYNLQKKAIESNNDDTNYFTSLDSLRNYANASRGETDSSGNLVSSFETETNTLWQYANAGSIARDSVIALTNGSGKTIYVKYTKNGFVAANESDYNKANHQYTITRNNSSKKSDDYYNEFKQVK